MACVSLVPGCYLTLCASDQRQLFSACRSFDGGAPSVKMGDIVLPTFAKPTDFSARRFKPLAGKSATDLQLVINVI